MERVTAYKAYNGRLFESEEKCLAYEEKLRQYPKIKCATIPQTDGVIKCVTSVWEKPSSQRKDESYFLVGDKVKLFSSLNKNVGDLITTDILYQHWQPLDKITANVILNNGVTFNAELAEQVCTIYNQCLAEQMKKSPYKFPKRYATITETDNKTYWVIEDKSWLTGAVSPTGRYVKVEL